MKFNLVPLPFSMATLSKMTPPSTALTTKALFAQVLLSASK